MGIPTLGLFRDGKLIDRLVGYPGGALPIKAWIEKSSGIAASEVAASDVPAQK
jgi:hypothetical protein